MLACACAALYNLPTLSHPTQTLGSIFCAVSFSLLLAKVALTRAVTGISLKTLQAYFLVYIARLCSILVRALR